MESRKRPRENDSIEIERSKKQRAVVIDLGNGVEFKVYVDDNPSVYSQWELSNAYELIETLKDDFGAKVDKIRSKKPPHKIFIGKSGNVEHDIQIFKKLGMVSVNGTVSKKIKNDNIIPIIDYAISVVNGKLKLYYVMEAGIWDLEKQNKRVFENNMKYNDMAIYSIIKQVASGLKFLHSHKVIHGDMKPANVIVVDNRYKIADFGSAKIIGVDKGPIFGTMLYIAPETFINGEDRKYSEKIDVWSLGILFLQLCIDKELIHYNPKPKHGLEFIDEYIKRGNPSGNLKISFRELTGYYNLMDEDVKNAIERIRQNTRERENNNIPNITNPILFNMVRERVGGYGTKLLRDMLQFDPEKRLSIDDVLDRIENVPKQNICKYYYYDYCYYYYFFSRLLIIN